MTPDRSLLARPNPDQLISFRDGTRQRSWVLPAQPFVPGNRLSFLLPQSGYLARAYVRIFGSIRRSAGDTNAPVSPLWGNIFNRVQLTINIGAGFPVDLIGAHLQYLNSVLQRSYAAGQGGLGGSTSVPTVNAPFTFPIPGVGTTDTPFSWQFIIPVNTNDGINFEDGLINLQALEVQAAINILCGTVTDIFPVGSVLTGTSFQNVMVEVVLETYEVPRPGTNVMIPAFILHRLVSDSQPINSVGVQSYRPLPEGRLLQLMHLIVVDNSLEDGMFNIFTPGTFQVGDFEIWLNQGDRNYQYTRFVKDLLWRLNYGSNPVNGVKIWDFFNSFEMVSGSDARDTYDLTQIAVFESRMAMSGPLGAAGTNRIDTMRRLLQPLKV